MIFLDHTCDVPHANIALDEALLEDAEAGHTTQEVLRLWEPSNTIVVMGRSSPSASEVNLRACENDGVAVIRRCSGGATIVTAPGCLMYAVVLSYQRHPKLRLLDYAHQFVMNRIRKAIQSCGIETRFQGTCDLTIANRKVSGNALRCKREWLVYHGTLICNGMDVGLISKYLGTPKRQPDYRNARDHKDFLARIPVETERLSRSLFEAWECRQETKRWPEKRVIELVNDKYSQDEWNFKL